MVTLESKIAAAGNRPAGWDYLRLFLATAVVVSHGIYAESARAVFMEWLPPCRGLVGMILPCFFALSGFLIAGSLERTRSLITFLGLRIIRLVPALIVETTLSALVLGIVFTTVPLHTYLTSRQFFSYFGNIVGWVHFYLPGVFQSNPSTKVNSQLWTLPYEMQCYAVISVLAIIGIASRRYILLIFILLIQVVFAIHFIRHGSPVFPYVIHGRTLVASFLSGVAIYKFRQYIPHNTALFIGCTLLAVFLLNVTGGDNFVFIPAAYATTWLGVQNPTRNQIILSGDYSYGLFLYGFPIQQAVTALGVWTHHWWFNLAVAYPLALGFAVFSWWCIERPALGLKAILTHCEKSALKFPPLRWHSERIYVRNAFISDIRRK